MSSDPIERERAVLDLLDAWPWEMGGVVIGGYALAAYQRPRYSDDLDIVLSREAAPAVRAWLLKAGFVPRARSLRRAEEFGEDAQSFSHEDVSVDLLVGRVRDREAKVDIPEPWISRAPQVGPLRTLIGQTTRPVPVVRLEALWALKLQAGRDQDLTDLFSIATLPVEDHEVRSLFRSLWCPSLEQKLARTIEKLTAPKIFEDSMSRLGSKRSPAAREEWTAFQRLAARMVPDRSTPA